MNEINSQKVKKLGKSFNIVDSPQIVFDLCDKAYKRSRQKQLKGQHFMTMKPQLTKKLLQQRKKELKRKVHQSQYIENQKSQKKENRLSFVPESSIKQYSTEKIHNLDKRRFYSQVKQRLKQLLNKIQQQKDIMISQVMLIKQDILSSFFSQIIQKTKQQCKQKGQLLQFIWNSMFSILQLTMKQLVHEKNHNQKHYLQQHIKNHYNYQSMLEFDKVKISQLKQQLRRTQVLNNTLIFNSRCKRRQLRKAYIKLKVSTNKLNQYKENYLDLQKDYIDLMIETKDVSRQMAQYLFKRRQQILNDKKKTFKLKFSKKTNFIKAKQELQNQNPHELNKIKQQLKTAFNKQYEKQISQQQQQGGQSKKITKLQNFLFQDAMDEFAFYQNTQIIDDDFMAAKNKTQFVDAQTDMIGFELDVQQKQCQVDYIDKIVHGMLRNAGQQTVTIEQKVKKIFIEGFVQVNVTQIDRQKLHQHNQVIDMSFLFQKKANFMASLYSKKIENNIQNNNSYSYSPSNYSRQSSVKKSQGRVSLRISSKKGLNTKNRLSQSSLSQSQNNSQHKIATVQSVYNQNQVEDQNNTISKISSNPDFHDYSSKLAIKKSLKKKKLINFHDKNQNINDQNSKFQIEDDFYEDNLQSKRINTQSYSKKNLITTRNNLSQNKNNHTISQVDHTQRKHLKRQVLVKNQNEKSPQHNTSRFKDLRNNEIQQKTKIIHMISKSCKKIQLINPQTVFNEIKQQNSDLNLYDDNKIKEIIKSNQQQQKQQHFKSFYQSLKPMIDDLFKHIEITRRYNKSLIPSREKNFLKTISNVYFHTYRLLQKEQQIYSFVNPLVRYFQIQFGTLKKSQLYMKIISFLSHIYLFKDNSHIFNSFIFFTAMDRENPLSSRITNQDFLIYLKLVKSLSFNFDLSNGQKNFNVQNLFTSNKMLQKYTRQVFEGENINRAVVDKIINKVYQKLQKTTGIDLRSKSLQKQKYGGKQLIVKFSDKKPSGKSYRSNFTRSQSKWVSNSNPSNEQEQQIKLDVFFCTQLIMQQFIQMKKLLQESYMPLINHVYQQEKEVENYRIDESLIKFIIGCQFQSKLNQVKCYQVLSSIFKINSLYDQYKLKIAPSSKSIKTQRTLKTIKFILPENENNSLLQHDKQRQTLSLSQMCSFFMKANISDLNRTYYNALGFFKMKEETAYKICLRKLNEIKTYFLENNFEIESILLHEITNDHSLDVFSSSVRSNTFFNSLLKQNFNSSKNQFFSSTLQKQSTNGMTLQQVHNKKLLVLCLFRYLQAQTNSTFQNIIGKDLLLFNNYLPTLKLRL